MNFYHMNIDLILYNVKFPVVLIANKITAQTSPSKIIICRLMKTKPSRDFLIIDIYIFFFFYSNYQYLASHFTPKFWRARPPLFRCLEIIYAWNLLCLKMSNFLLPSGRLLPSPRRIIESKEWMKQYLKGTYKINKKTILSWHACEFDQDRDLFCLF